MEARMGRLLKNGDKQNLITFDQQKRPENCLF
jgi:hypothetical protein